jgi:hypothetical protein
LLTIDADTEVELRRSSTLMIIPASWRAHK